jgi:ABC-type multidrug transport system fused ATPase/permease subunit
MSAAVQRHTALLRRYLQPESHDVLSLAVLLVLGIACQLLSPQVVRLFIDNAESSAGDPLLLRLAAAFLILAIVQRSGSMAALYFGERIGWASTNRLRDDLTRHCLSLGMAFHASHTPGDMIERVDGDVTLLANYFSRFVMQVVGNALLVGGILCFVFAANLLAGLVLTAYTVLVVVVLRVLSRIGVRRNHAARQASADQYGYIEERIAGTEDIRSNGAEAAILLRLFGALYATRRAVRHARLAAGFLYVGANIAFALGYGVGLALGVILYSHHALSLGTTFALVYYIGMLNGPVDQLQQQAQDMQRALAGVGRIESLLSLPPAIAEHPRVTLRGRDTSVEFQRVCFGYTAAEPVLHDQSFDLPAGAVLGIVGRTGSGKTTISRLLARLYDPDSGAIRIGGADLRDLSTGELREAVAVVPQDVQVFGGTVRDNLTFFDRSIDDAVVLRALHTVHLEAWLARLDAGLETVLQPGGSDLSAGEAQLLACARVFIRDPRVVVLDEASSRLDPFSERVVGAAIGRLFSGRTTIVIAHRLQTLDLADYILVLDGGRVAEFGRRAALAGDPNSRFSALLQAGMEVVRR